METTNTSRLKQAIGGVVLAAAAGMTLAQRAGAQALTDADIFNFALNLEYLEAEYYLAAIGRAPTYATTGTGTEGAVIGGRPVNFTTSAIEQYAREIGKDEEDHVKFLRQVLGAHAVARPAIDFTGAFNRAAQLAFNNPEATFDPFSGELPFLLGAFVFEDVGVTAYKGASPLLTDPTNLGSAAGILGTEAYHAANIRTTLYRRRAEAVPGTGRDVQQVVQAISDLRDTADGPADLDQGIVGNNTAPAGVANDANVVPTDPNAVAFSRTAAQVLRIVYLAPPPGAASSGGFFPNGMNGTIRSVAESQL